MTSMRDLYINSLEIKNFLKHTAKNGEFSEILWKISPRPIQKALMTCTENRSAEKKSTSKSQVKGYSDCIDQAVGKREKRDTR